MVSDPPAILNLLASSPLSRALYTRGLLELGFSRVICRRKDHTRTIYDVWEIISMSAKPTEGT